VDIRRVQDPTSSSAGAALQGHRAEPLTHHVVLSRRAVLEEEREDQRQRILDKLNPGDVVGDRSRTSSISGVVDLDGMDL
jgi:small subunit ribosomal protein S1